MKSAIKYSSAIDSVLNQMAILQTCCYKCQTLLADGKIISIEWVWSSDEAKQSFELLEKRLVSLIKAQQDVSLKENTQ